MDLHEALNVPFLGIPCPYCSFRVNSYGIELKGFPIVVVIYLTGSSVSFSGELTDLISSPKSEVSTYTVISNVGTLFGENNRFQIRIASCKSAFCKLVSFLRPRKLVLLRFLVVSFSSI